MFQVPIARAEMIKEFLSKQKVPKNPQITDLQPNKTKKNIWCEQLTMRQLISW